MADERQSEGPERTASEYADERDMERFWQTARLTREPLKQRWYVPALILLIIVSIPWYRTSGDSEPFLFGLPAWILVPLVCALGLSILTTLAILRFWGDDDSGSD